MGKIVLLDELTINQIAAGEVIERPASVIKEMVENSIDAGAKNITVEIKKGGIELIKITDDGSGIAEDDMEIAFERHATSKIRSAEDLATVKSMGFRGEALASIAAISKVEMISKTADEDTGYKIVVEGGDVKEKSEVACQKGTTITVENLFYNTPVRYKFLKKDYTEAGYIEDVVTRIALVNKDVSIKLINSGKVILQTNGNNDSKTVIYSIYGKEVSNGIIDVDYTYEDMKITGVIGKPEIARSNRSYQLFFINSRYVKDKNLTSAADQAYKDILPVGKFGFLILNIEMDPNKVDVNVHPAKLEVRFQDESQMFKAVFHAIKSVLPANTVSSKVNNILANTKFDNIVPVEKPVTKIEDISVEKEVNDIKIAEPETNYDELEPEKDIIQPKIRTGFSELLKKVRGETDNKREEYDNNVLESIFEERNGKKRVTPDFKSNIEENSVVDEKKVEDIKEIDEPDEPDTKESEIIEKEDEKLVGKTIKFGNVSITSDTAELGVNLNELIKAENNKKEEIDVELNVNPIVEEKVDEVKIDDNKLIDDMIESIEEVVTEEEKQVDEEVVETEEEMPENSEQDSTTEVNNDVDLLTEAIVKNKINNTFSPTQVIDTKKIRENLNENDSTEITPEFAEMYKKTFGKDISKKSENKTEELESYNDFLYKSEEENLSVFYNEETYVPEVKYRFVGIVFDIYIIIEIDNEMYIIDQFSAQERIMYEMIKNNYYNEEKKDSQMLLLPDIITLTRKEVMIAKENEELFIKAGFGFEEFGENTLKLYAVPSMCEKLNTKQLFVDIVDELDSVAITATQEKEEKFITTIASKTAANAKMKFDEKDVIVLINNLLKLQNPFVGPQKKNAAIKMTKIDFEKKFNRR